MSKEQYRPKAPYAKCDQCPLATRPCVPSYIPHGASLMIIGEKPGTQELLDGMPFSPNGDSGKILESALIHHNIRPNDVAKTNAVLCRTYADQDVPQEAIQACSMRLAHEIAISGAKRLIASGNVAAYAIDQLAGVESSSGVLGRAGKVYRYNENTTYGITVNPAYILRNDEYMPHFLRHIEQSVNPIIHDFDINQIIFAVATINLWVKIQEYVARFEQGSPMAFDVESNHLQWYDTPSLAAADLLCIVLTFEATQSIIIPASMLRIDYVAQTIRSWFTKYTVIAHNGKFDQHIAARPIPLGLDTSVQIDHDTMLMHYALYELGGHGLKELATTYLNAPDYEEMLIGSWFKSQKIKAEDRRYSEIPKENLYMYAAIDGVVTWLLYHVFKEQLIEQKLWDRPYLETYMPCVNALTTIEETGIGIDREHLRITGMILEHDRQELATAMNTMIMPLVNSDQDASYGELARLMKPKRKKDQPRYNPGSPQQTHHVIYNVFKLKPTHNVIAKSATMTGSEVLEALPDHAFIRMLRQYRRVAKLHDTYVVSLDRRADLDDILHIDFKFTGTEIGRLSANNGDHGIPRPDDFYGARIRSAFVACQPTRRQPKRQPEVLIIADYNQAELRTFAYLANVKFLLDKYHAGLDVHNETALMLEELGADVFKGYANLQYTKKQLEASHGSSSQLDPIRHQIKALRTLAKNINFGNIYQGGAQGIAGMMGGSIPVKVISQVLTYYRKLMPEAYTYAARQFEQLRTQGYVTTIFNRHRRFYVIHDQNIDEARKAAVHMVVAGSAADLNNHSAKRLVAEGVQVCHLIHDSIIARASLDEAEHIAKFMQETMVAVGHEYMPSIPWIVDIDTNDNGTYPTRWINTPDMPEHYQLALGL